MPLWLTPRPITLVARMRGYGHARTLSPSFVGCTPSHTTLAREAQETRPHVAPVRNVKCLVPELWDLRHTFYFFYPTLSHELWSVHVSNLKLAELPVEKGADPAAPDCNGFPSCRTCESFVVCRFTCTVQVEYRIFSCCQTVVVLTSHQDFDVHSSHTAYARGP